jgi:hypothetical protein
MAAALLPVILRRVVEFADAENAGQPALRHAIVSPRHLRREG